MRPPCKRSKGDMTWRGRIMRGLPNFYPSSSTPCLPYPQPEGCLPPALISGGPGFLGGRKIGHTHTGIYTDKASDTNIQSTPPACMCMYTQGPHTHAIDTCVQGHTHVARNDTGIYTLRAHTYSIVNIYNDINTCVTSRRPYKYIHNDIHILSTLIPNTRT